MKNFRKVLALVLVVATLFSFTAMAGAANKYEDADKVSYEEAVTVLSHVGVLEGYEIAEDEFEFRPTNTISREEMAKMIAVMANAGDDVSTLYASACTFADVAKTRWSASYVAYCAKTGIVAGRSATTFDPTGKVTGLETAKMLLVTLGFDADKQGYIGADWKVNVMRDAKAMGLLDNFAAGYDVEAAITREEAAQMMLNALETNVVVGYLSDAAKVIVTNKAYNSWDNMKWTLLDASGNAKLYGKVVISDDTLGNALFGLSRVTAAERDCYGRPATSWKYTTVNGTVKTIGVYAGAPVFSSANTTAKKVDAATVAYDTMPAQLWVDGQQNTSVNTVEQAIAALDIGKGTQVEVYVTANSLGQKYIVFVVINTYIAKIGQVNTAYHTVDLDNVNGNPTGSYNFVNEFGLTPDDQGKVALFWVCKDRFGTPSKLHDLKIITPAASAKVISCSGAKNTLAVSTFTTDEKTWEYAHTFGKRIQPSIGIIGEGLDASWVGKTIDIYVDEEGFVMWYKESDGPAMTYAVLDDASVEATPTVMVQGTQKYTYTANFVPFAANPVEGADVAVGKSVYDVDWKYSDFDTLVRYYEDAKGLKQVVAGDTATQVDGSYNLTKYTVDNTAINAATKTIDDETQILVRYYDWMTGKHIYKYFDGKDEVDATYIVTHIQYFANTANTRVAYMYAQAETVVSNAKVFVLDYDHSTIDLVPKNAYTGQNKIGYNLYEALVDGEPALIATENVLTPESTTTTNGVATDNYFRVYNMNTQYIGKQTNTGKPIYIADIAPLRGVGSNFTVSNGILSWTSGMADLDTNAVIVVAFPKTWDDDNDPTTDKLTYIKLTAAELNKFAEKNGWSHGYGWYGSDDLAADKDVDMLYVCATAKDYDGSTTVNPNT